MAAILRKFLPVAPSPSRKEGGEANVDGADNGLNPEYSIALEYTGPPINYDAIPRAAPVDFDQITTALTLSSSSVFDDISVPIIQPIVDIKLSKAKKVPKDSQLRSKHGLQAGSMVGSVVLHSGDDAAAKLSSSFSSTSPSRRKHNSGAASVPSGRESDHDKIESSEDMGSGDYLRTRGLPQRGDKLQFREESDDIGGFEEGRNPLDSESVKSDTRSVTQSTHDFSSRDKDGDSGTPFHNRKASVTFVDPSTADEESECSECLSVQVVPRPERRGKKGTCYRCLKGNRFTEKETCIVCDAKYCFNCVLRAMGSMPEGRKCIICIGKRINEAKRRRLGKCSRLLRCRLTDLEVQQIMKAEVSCKANRFPSELIYVNGEPLNEEDVFALQSCPCPPKRLKPGRYWYDKVAGYWGKEGQKPSQIISPELNVGGNIKRDASNGDTTIVINNREITKSEVMMLQMAGVRCEANTSFWVSADGSYQEEGQKNVLGRIWDRKRARLACAILSLPIQPNPMKSPPDEPQMGYFQQKKLHKLLLVGSERSGTSTIYKQARLLYNVPFSEGERESVKLMMQKSLCCYLMMLLEEHEQCEEENMSEKVTTESSDHAEEGDISAAEAKSTGLKNLSDKTLEAFAYGNLDITFTAACQEHAPAAAELHGNSALQAIYDRWREIETLPGAAWAMEILRPDYEPSNLDIVHSKGIPWCAGLSCFEFSFPSSPYDSCLDEYYQHDPSTRYQLIRSHPRHLGENCRWLEMFEDMDMVIFCVSLTDYDECIEGDGVPVNKMMLTKTLFETVVTHSTLREKKFLLILNKFDLLEKKISRAPLTVCEWFSDFNPVMSQHQNSSSSKRSPSMAQRAFHYIASKFKRLFDDAVTDKWVDCRRSYRHKLFVFQANALDADTVDLALRYTRDIIKWHVEEASFVQEISTTSIEASSFS